MTFDQIMAQSGLDPNGQRTFVLMDLDDLNLAGVTGRDLVEIGKEAVNLDVTVYTHRKMNLVGFMRLVHLRLLEMCGEGVMVDHPAACLQQDPRPPKTRGPCSALGMRDGAERA